MAGVYATTDKTRGVWKAPANVSINSIVKPSVAINDYDQKDLRQAHIQTTGVRSREIQLRQFAAVIQLIEEEAQIPFVVFLALFTARKELDAC